MFICDFSINATSTATTVTIQPNGWAKGATLRLPVPIRPEGTEDRATALLRVLRKMGAAKVVVRCPKEVTETVGATYGFRESNTMPATILADKLELVNAGPATLPMTPKTPDKMTKDELVILATDMGLAIPAGASKKDILALVTAPPVGAAAGN